MAGCFDDTTLFCVQSIVHRTLHLSDDRLPLTVFDDNRQQNGRLTLAFQQHFQCCRVNRCYVTLAAV
jgi:hypothetical protein